VAGGAGTKRKYRRHPKVSEHNIIVTYGAELTTPSQPDENAPERPASAYVIFSNRTQ